MVSTYIDFQPLHSSPKAHYNEVTFTSSHTFTPNGGSAAMQGATRPIGGNLGFSALPKDTLANRRRELGSNR